MGDRRKQALRVQFDGKIKLRFHGAKITSDAGLLAFCELDEAFRWTERGGTVLSDPRHRKIAQYTMPPWYGRASLDAWPATKMSIPAPPGRSVCEVAS
ncbi:MAG: transposase [Planctomycetes bacterium]|nr:transposase [Planctomycetota bacterium]